VPRDVVRPTPSADDEAVALASRLPADASRCVVAQPGRVESARRPLLARVAQAHRLAWDSNLEVRVLASAEQADREGARRALWLLRVEGAPQAVRDALAAQPHVALRWDEGVSCDGVECPARAQQDGDGTVRIAQGRALALRRAGAAIAESPCAQLARDAPEAVEVSVSESVIPGVLRETRVLRIDGDRIGMEQRLSTRGAPAVARALAWLDAVERAGVDAMLGDGAWRRVARTVGDDVIVERFEADFHALALRAEDDERLNEALRAERALGMPLPIADVDLRDPEAVALQRALREAQLVRLSGAAHAAALHELVALLEAGHRANPDDAETAQALVRLRLGIGAWGEERANGAAVAALAAEMAERAPLDAQAWRALEREGLALAGSTDLARALVRDGVAVAAEAERVAMDAIAARRAGFAYAWAEGGAVVGQRFDALAAREPMARVASVPLSLVGLPAALVRLLWLGAPDSHAPFAVYVLAHASSMPDVVSAVESAGARSVRIAGPRGGVSQLLAARSDEGVDALAALGAHVARSLAGAVHAEVALAFVPLDAPTFAPATHVVLRGSVRDGFLVVEGVSRPAASLDWARVAETLASPLGALVQRFPLPAIEIALRDEAEARRALERVIDAECRADGARIRCVGLDARALADAVHAIAAPLLATSPRALWRTESSLRRTPPRPRRARNLPVGPRAQ